MRGIPRDRSLDSSFAFKRDPYGFISKRCRRLGSDVFVTRLLLRRTVCMTGPDAARLFYVYIVFVAHALHQNPAARLTLEARDPAYAHAFVHEVRRFYPFFPAVPARVRVRDVRYSVPSQDLTIDDMRVPAMPRSRFVIANVARR